MAETVKITVQDLTEKVEAGWKKPALAEHYGLPVSQMTLALKQAGLKIRKFHKPKFELVNEEVVADEDTIEITDRMSEAQPDINEEVEYTLENSNDSEQLEQLDSMSEEVATPTPVSETESANNQGSW